MRHAIPDDWDGETFCRFAICWPDSTLWRALLRGLVTEPARGFFWDEKTGSIRGVLADFRQTVDHNLDLPEVFMACNDQNIATALQAIATALASQNSNSNATAIAQCGGGGGSSSVSNSTISVQAFVTLSDGTQWPVMGTQPIATIPPSGYPDGYADQVEYDADKCAKATKMANDFIASIENFATVNWATGVVGAGVILACLVGLITVPYATIPLLLFALCGNIGITAALSAFADELQNRRQDLICILYEGDTVEIIIVEIAEFLDLVIAFIDPVAAIGLALKNIALWLMNGDTLNALFSSAAKQAYPDADCSSCEEDVLCWFFTEGLDGFTYRQNFATWIFGGGSLEWLNLGAAIQNGFGNPGYSGMISPEFGPYTIQTGDVICVQISNYSSSNNYSEFVGAIINGQEVELSTTFGHLSQGAEEFSLEAYVGQDITQILLGWYYDGTFWVHIDSIGINCPACA